MSKFWTEGFEAGRFKGGADNPYPAGSFENDQWQKGYEEGVRKRLMLT